MFYNQNIDQSFCNEKIDFCHLRFQPLLISLIKVFSQSTSSAYFMYKRKQWLYLVNSRVDFVIIKKSYVKKEEIKPHTFQHKP